MLRLLPPLLGLLLAAAALPAQARLLVSGNLAEAGPDFYTALADRLAEPAAEPAHVLLLGDYAADCDGPRAGLEPLLALARAHPAVPFYLIPGDRDWDRSGPRGLDCVTALEGDLRARGPANLHWPLRNGCPGPERVELTPHLLLLLINTQWWNHPHAKPVPADARCDFADPGIAYGEIIDAIEEHQDQNVVVAGHYPPQSQGRYGGKYPVRDHFLPPVAGSFRISYRQNIGTPEELTNARFRALGDKLAEYNAQFRGLLFLGSQDRSQQLLNYGRNYLVNAGSPGPGRWVARHRPAIHTDRRAGLTELTFAADGSVTYRYWLTQAGPVAYERLLWHAPCGGGADSSRANPAFPPCRIDSLALAEYAAPADSTLRLAAGPQYGISRFGARFLGAHYRSSWTTEVDVPVLNLAEFTPGLRPLREGGGRQTTSLKLGTTAGAQYVFRSVDKDPTGTFNYQIRNTLIGDAVRDQTSSGHPYGGLVVAPLLDPLGILHTEPRLYSLAPGPELGDFNPRFGGLLGTLEARPRGARGGRPGTFGAEDVLKSYELFRERYDDQEVAIDHREFLRARLFDLLIGDWSRHEDNWRWATFAEDGLRRVRPVPRDRDNAFSRLDGFFPWIASRRWAVPNLEDFGYRKPDIRSLSYQARHLDRLLLSPLERADFRAEAERIRGALSDSIIAAAVDRMPAAARAVSGDELAAKLRARRDELADYAADYYRLHARTVDVVGTNDGEEFRLEAGPGGRLTVTVTDLRGRGAGRLLYARSFTPAETREVRAYGLGGKDRFVTVGPVGRAIRVRLIGGQGADRYDRAGGGGAAGAKVYELDSLGQPPRGPLPGFRPIRSRRDYLYYYDRTALRYNTLVPNVGLGYNSFNGTQLGVGLTHTRRNYVRRDYSARYRFYAEASTLGNFALEASADYGELLGRYDLIFASRLGRPDFYNFFFGLGNRSPRTPERDRNDFNLIRLNHFSASGGLRRRFARRSTLTLLAGYQTNNTTERENTILDRADRLYGDGDLVFGYLEPALVLDLRDHPVFPSKGVMLEASHKQAFGRKTPDFGVSRVAAEFHFSTRRFPISLSFRTGYAISNGRVPFYEAPTLGRNNGLRGFRRNRFVGDSYFFYNTEFRSPVALVRSRVAPFAVGIRAFYDRGKILQTGEAPSGFHDAWGGGLYIIPLKKAFTLSALAGFSDEERWLWQFGAGTNF